MKRLNAHEYERLASGLEHVQLAFKETLYEQGKPLTHVYFIEAGVGSVVVELKEEGDIVEVATVGREGFVGLPVFFDEPVATAQCFIQVVGAGYRMKADAFKRLLPELPGLHALLMSYTSAVMTMISQSAACNRMHVVEARLARWLLMTHDRVDGDDFALTQEFLGAMLGVRRPAVSIAGATLQRAGLIRYTRGRIAVLDRKGLEEASCECYAHVKRALDRSLGG